MLIRDLRLRKMIFVFAKSGEQRRVKSFPQGGEPQTIVYCTEMLSRPSHNEFFGDKAKFFVPGNL